MQGSPDNIQEDIRSAITEARENKGESAPLEGHDDFLPQVSTVLPPVELDDDKAPKDGETARGPDGKFLPKTEGQESGTPPPPAPPVPSVPAPAPVVGQEFKLDPAKPPAAWTPAMKEKWNGIPEDVRAEITRREEATAIGIHKLQQHYEPLENWYKVVAPHQQYFDHIKEDPGKYFNDMVGVEQTLRMGNPAQKMSMILSMADVYKIPIRDTLDKAMNGGLDALLQQAHQAHRTPVPIPSQIQQEIYELRQYREEMEDYAATTEMNAFAADVAHPFFEQVREQMADLIERGAADSYQDAYDIAVFRDPAIRAQALAQQNGQAQQTGVQQRQAAAASVVAPSPSALVTSGKEDDENEDTIDTVKKAWVAASNRA